MAGKRDPKSHRTPEQIKKMDRGYNATPEMVSKRTKNNQARSRTNGEINKLVDSEEMHYFANLS